MEQKQSFLKRKNIEISLHRYGIQAMGAMAQGLFATLIIGLILKVIGENLNIPFLYEGGLPCCAADDQPGDSGGGGLRSPGATSCAVCIHCNRFGGQPVGGLWRLCGGGCGC